jgi:hypothetical protein
VKVTKQRKQSKPALSYLTAEMATGPQRKPSKMMADFLKKVYGKGGRPSALMSKMGAKSDENDESREIWVPGGVLKIHLGPSVEVDSDAMFTKLSTEAGLNVAGIDDIMILGRDDGNQSFRLKKIESASWGRWVVESNSRDGLASQPTQTTLSRTCDCMHTS